MKIYKLYDLHQRELNEIYNSLGGKYDLRDRLARDGTGSPRLYYLDGHPEINELRKRAVDELRINFEEFKTGLLVGIAERTNPYILPLRPADIRLISIVLTEEKVRPRQGSFFSWLLRNGVGISVARFFARPGEHVESRTDFTLQTTAFSIHCWTTAGEFRHVRAFFEKSNLKQLVKITG